MKYCIGCKNLHFQDKRIGSGSTMTGAYTISEAAMFCNKGHWKRYLDDGAVCLDLERAMESAETCADFQERES